MATSAPKKSAPRRPAAAEKSAAKSAEPAAKKSAAKKKAPAKQSAVKQPSTKKAPAKPTPKKRVAMKTNENRTPATAPAKAPAKKAEKLTVKDGEKPWTAAEMEELRGELVADATHLREEIRDAEQEIVGLLRDGGDGAGNDQADVGSTTLERDHEMSLANNARDMLDQIERALARIDDGTYGVCESCGKAVGKGRLQAFPRATLCVSCKEREERR
ncbi:TraR/DksA C4-type zinc finger protein [Kribbella catacumbae]|uniref:TraR/DksA C4-type zinc finger protein n=1 Tax=Kribbella catacumbae TaxID=460086 RepID=UPI00037F32DD